MKTEQEILELLRRAPQPRPPKGLKPQLIRQIDVPGAAGGQGARRPSARAELRARSAGRSWFAAWWPALAAGCLALACFTLAAVQHLELRQLRAARTAARTQATPVPDPGAPAGPVATEGRNGSTAAASAAALPDERQEILRLGALAEELATDVRALEQMRAQNEQLQQQVAARQVLTAQEVKGLEEAREKARSVQCVNHLKQIGLAARIWATDHGDVLPPDFASMSQALGSPKVLVCPSDTLRQPAADWALFTLSNCSYDYLAPSGSEAEPARVMVRCPFHGNITLVDGSVQMGVAKSQPERLVLREGKLVYADAGGSTPERGSRRLGQPGAVPLNLTQPASPGAVPMDRRLMERYGLLPEGSAAQSAQPTGPGVAPRIDPRIAERYGLLPPGAAAVPPPTPPPPTPEP
ncbi:MAG: DUF1559 domain-containing protein [Verrucomicrobia bacterium]|nr:DUF1559 domain-containing protein [Verrucomicrobiota bacterium]